MGCDIHLYIEVYDDKSKTWQLNPASKSEPDDDDGTFDGVEDDEEEDIYESNSEWGNRNYSLFGILADVRRGHQAGPIANPGVPEDASVQYKKILDRWNGDAHSEHYISLAELKSQDWKTKRFPEKAYLNARMYKEALAASKTGEIDTANLYGYEEIPHRGREVTVDELKRIIANNAMSSSNDDISNNGYALWTWLESLSEATSGFDGIIPELEALGKDDKVRLVFFFDN